MRLDKYLKTARILKRRTVANELADNGRVSINGKPAKPSREVQPGDVITVSFGNRELTVRVVALENSVKKSEASSLYEVIDQKFKEPEKEDQQ